MAFAITTLIAALLCGLTAGFLLGFAVVVMPGIRRLGDRQFLDAFRVMDGIIQNNQPVFIVVWAGSVVALIASAAMGLAQLEGVEKIVLAATAILYLLGVQLPTATINIPLNNRLQALDLAKLDDESLHSEREGFEPRWNRWNVIRTVVAILTTGSLLCIVARL